VKRWLTGATRANSGGLGAGSMTGGPVVGVPCIGGGGAGGGSVSGARWLRKGYSDGAAMAAPAQCSGG
jgi:hypothetical protein